MGESEDLESSAPPRDVARHGWPVPTFLLGGVIVLLAGAFAFAIGFGKPVAAEASLQGFFGPVVELLAFLAIFPLGQTAMRLWGQYGWRPALALASFAVAVFVTMTLYDNAYRPLEGGEAAFGIWAGMIVVYVVTVIAASCLAWLFTKADAD